MFLIPFTSGKECLEKLLHFGKGKECNAVRNITASVLIGNKNYISVEAGLKDIPLLINKESLKCLGMELISCVSPWTNQNLDADDTSRIMWDLDADDTNVMLHMKVIGEFSKSETRKKTQKLHK